MLTCGYLLNSSLIINKNEATTALFYSVTTAQIIASFLTTEHIVLKL